MSSILLGCLLWYYFYAFTSYKELSNSDKKTNLWEITNKFFISDFLDTTKHEKIHYQIVI